MKVLLILNDAPYGSEKVYNSLRLATTLQQDHHDVEVRVFLLADAVTAALTNQSTPQGYYNVERLLKAVISRGGQVKACGTCSAARGIKEVKLMDGIEISTMSQLAQWTVDSDRVVVF